MTSAAKTPVSRCVRAMDIHRWLAVLVMVGLAGCGGGPLGDRLDSALATGRAQGMQPQWLDSGPFTLLAQIRIQAPDQPLRLYIEGDGFAWITRTRPSPDPTPHRPVALWLAARDPAPNVAWLARPCQYSMLARPETACDRSYWTHARMAPTVIEAVDAAVTALREQAGATAVELVGYSGGGGIAAVLTARRSDVVALRTVAGNLDSGAFVRHHRVSPMTGSVDAVTEAAHARAVPQIHFVGDHDRIVPPFLADTFIRRAGPAAVKIVVPGMDHAHGWDTAWPTLLQHPLPDVAKTSP
ncbi:MULTISPECIES: alpha/beta hydrolase [unclassified Haematospirillum]|uniref:alpha/beta hydrolase n=1 Tax=unclassified Haematospirillum TaxID=2622088 RepID=UPI00143A1ED1|nr:MULTISPECIES: alpha/beta hydrolase [unclassified Haematospirillum]NKD55792.1 alpha/beta hydrolase [Haematospirillum sp. H4890]NKD75897.1 alpha/beta hydrolase [Haematospirillum sp. H4485]